MREYTEFTIPEFLLYIVSLVVGLFCMGAGVGGVLDDYLALGGALACMAVNMTVIVRTIRKGR